MGRLRKLGATTNPLIVIEWIISIVTLIGGIYLLSPVVKTGILLNLNSPIAAAVASQLGIVILGMLAVLTALLLIAGIVKMKVKVRSFALFLIGLMRLYAVLAGILINGIFPFTWLSNAALMIICFYIWGRIRRRGTE